MIFNGIEKNFIKVNMGLFRPPTPPIEFLTSENRKGGSRTRKKRFTDMILPVPITINSDRPIELLKEEISDWLYHEEPKKLIFKQIQNRYYLAEYESMDLDEKSNYAKGTINFYLAIAHRFGIEKTITLSSVERTITVTGQVRTPWKSRTVFTVATSMLSIESNSGKIILNHQFKSGDVLEIDYDKRDIILNGKDLATALSLESVWFDLVPGQMKLKSSRATELRYDERYY